MFRLYSGLIVFISLAQPRWISEACAPPEPVISLGVGKGASASPKCFDSDNNIQADSVLEPPLNCTSAADRVALTLKHEVQLPGDIFHGCYPLPPASFQRSLVNRCNPRLSRAIRRVQSGLSLTVVTLGGSVAYGNEAGGPLGASNHWFVVWLQQRYPKANVTHHNLARGATDSIWILANSELIARYRPDLVLYDYSTNDISPTAASEPVKMRSISEAVVRTIYSMPSAPAIIQMVLFRSPRQGRDALTLEVETEGIEPVAEYYDVTLISYRKAIWPSLNRPPSGGVIMFKKTHPLWYVHRLIGDLYCYAWAALEHEMAARKPIDGLETLSYVLPAVKYTSNDVEALKSCSTPLTHLKHDSDLGDVRLFDAPLDVGDGWVYSNKTKKEGWLFDYLHMNDTATSGRRRLAFRKITRKRKKRSNKPILPGIPILPDVSLLPSKLTFNVSFSKAHPTLVISYLRSYEHFGKAVVIIDEDFETAALRIRKNMMYRTNYCDVADAEVSTSGANAVHPPCMQMRHGFMDDPFVLNGQWEDRSSQLAVAVFNRKYELAVGPFGNYLEPHVYVPVNKAMVPKPGWHNVSIAMILDRRDKPANPSRPERSRFKLFALKSC